MARDFKNSVTDEFFAATPPWEATKLLLSLAANQGNSGKRTKQYWEEEKRERKTSGDRYRRGVLSAAHWVANRTGKGTLKLDLLDISRAHFNEKPKELTYVELPPERHQPGMCGLLNFKLYGTRGAAQAWEEHYGDNMKNWGFEQGRGCPCVFVHKAKELIVVVHGDDFTSLGTDENLDWLREKFSGVYEYNIGVVWGRRRRT